MKKHYLKIIATFLLVAVVAIPLFACNDQDAPETTTTDPGEATKTPEEDAPLPTEISLPEAYATADIVYDCDDGSTLYNYKEKTAQDFAAVCDYYTEQGFRVYNSHTMAENPATTFVGDGPMAHVYWFKAKGELNIALSDTAANTLPPATPAVTDGEYECSVVQLMDNENVNGMSYIIQLKDGSYIIYDGSYATRAPALLSYLTENHKGEGKPLVRAWVLTHSHNDHYPAFQTFATSAEYADQVTVEYVLFSPLNDEHYKMRDEDRDPYFSTQLYEDVKGLKDAKLVFLHTGMLFQFCNLKMEVLMAPETLYMDTTRIDNFNDTSIVSRLYTEDYSALFLADIAIMGSDYMHEVYGSYLKSDICQVSHHGVEDVPLSFYEEVKASILYYPCNIWLYDYQGRNDDVRIALENREYTKEILIAGCGEYKRAWGTKFAEDAPLSMPNYTVPAHKQPKPETEPSDTPVEHILSTDKTTYTVGESIMVTAIGGGKDWVGIAKKGETSSMRWWYIDPVDGYVSVGSGVPFDAANGEANYNTEGPLAAGEYVIVIIPNDQPFASGDFKATVEITITE